jgi:hypothetical protein
VEQKIGATGIHLHANSVMPHKARQNIFVRHLYYICIYIYIYNCLLRNSSGFAGGIIRVVKEKLQTCLATRGPIHIIRQALPDESFELLRRSHIHNICIYILSCQAWPDTIHIIRQALPDESFITSLYFACVHADAAHCREAQAEQRHKAEANRKLAMPDVIQGHA